MRSLSIGATGMLAQQLNVEVISNNIANMNTTAYQRRRVEFQDLLYQNQRRVGSQSSEANTIVPVGVQVGLGVKTAAVYRIPIQGNLTLTENALDMAIDGKGYFQIDLPSGQTGYTRAGSFQLSNEGTIVTVDGYQLQPGLTVPANTIDIAINASGQVLAQVDGQTAQTVVGQIQLSTFANQAGLLAIGNNLLIESPASGAPVTGTPDTIGYGSVQQGFLETSNVNVVDEITHLITAQRAYEMNSKVIETSDQMLGTMTNIR
ncbi:MAG: flagellar basal-body rod protein FlgG [Alphaproteobacteria bacterium]